LSRALILLLATAAAVTLAGCASRDSGANGTDSETATTEPEHAVIVHLENTNLDEVFAIEDPLEQAIDDAGVGEYDGNEVAVDGSEAVLYAYGPDADALWDVMKPVVERATPRAGSYVIKRYGAADDAAAPEVRVELHGRS